MDLEFTDRLGALAENLEEFISEVGELSATESEDGEFTFMEDESGVSNTEIDNLVEILSHGLELVHKLIRV